MKMMYATVLAMPGIPLLYANDEKAVFNDYSYRDKPSQKEDSRWVHRIKTNWKKPFEYDSQKEVFDFVKNAIALRKGEKLFGGSEIFIYDNQNPQIFAYRRGTIHVVANFSEQPASFKIDAWSSKSRDLLSGKEFDNYACQQLGPYEVRWLKEEI